MSTKFLKSFWTFKDINDNELSNKFDEIMLIIDEKKNYEMNIYKFYSEFNIDPKSFFDVDNNNKQEINDDVYCSIFHHSLIIGVADFNQESNTLMLSVNKIFTNEEDKFNEDFKNVELNYDNINHELVISKDSIISKTLMIEEDIHLKYLKK